MVLLWRATALIPLINPPWFCMSCLFFTLKLTAEYIYVNVKGFLNAVLMKFLIFLSIEGGDVVKIAQLANIGNQNRISQAETPVTLQFQGNKFTLSPSQLRQLTTGQPLQLQGTLGNVHPIVILCQYTFSTFLTRGLFFHSFSEIHLPFFS